MRILILIDAEHLIKKLNRVIKYTSTVPEGSSVSIINYIEGLNYAFNITKVAVEEMMEKAKDEGGEQDATKD